MDVLIIDASALVQRFFSDSLGQGGHSVTGVGTCSEAINRIAQRRFDVIVAEMVLPDASVVDMLRIVPYPAPRVFLFAGLVPTNTFRIQARELGITRIFKKPDDISELVRAIQELHGPDSE